MADSKEEILYQLKIEENRALKSLTKVKEGVKTLDRRTTKYKETVKEQIRLESQLASIRKQRIQVNKGVEKSVKDLTKAQVQKKNAVGASTSATLELGRVLSDMPYGIRGVANNLQQLASNLFFMSKATDAATGKTVGFGGAVGRLLKGLIGPAGILIAFQGIIALFDYFSTGAKKAEDSVRDYLSGVDDLLKVQTDLNDKIEEYLVLQKLKQELDTSKTKSNKKLKELDEELLKIDKDKQSALKLLTLNQQAYQKSLDKTTTKSKGYLKGETENADKLEKLTKRENEINEERAGITGDYLEQLRKYREEKDNLTKADADTLKGLKEEIVQLKKKREIEAKLPEDYKRLSVAIDEVQKKIDEIEGKGSDRERVFTLVTPDSIKKQVKLGKGLIKAVAKVMNVELGKNPIDLNKLIDVELSDETKAAIAEYNRQLAIEMALTDKLLGAEGFVSKSQEVLGSMTDFMNAQFKRELTVEQNKTNALNVELNNRLNNENLSKDERVKIQNQIAINDEKLRVKQEKIAKKQFDMNKASNIANALMDTSAAAIGVMKDAKGGFLARLSQALPTIAFGLAQVATISRQKFQTSAAKTPIQTATNGGSDSASERSEPSFNIVGRSGENLLINAIQAQFGKPLKAYVVSRDVTTQQQLDGMIVGQAGT
jgi:hypothetical protein